MSKRHSNRQNSLSGPPRPHRVVAEQMSSPIDNGSEPLYSNREINTSLEPVGRQRAMSDATKAKAGKKPMPAPKPSNLSVGKSESHLKSKFNSNATRVVAPRPEENVYDNPMVVRKDRLVTKTEVEEEALYSEAIAVDNHLLPSEENGYLKKTHEEPIYDEAETVCVRKLPLEAKKSLRAIKSIPLPEPSIYEDPATVSVSRLPPSEVDDKVSEPIYSNASPVLSSRLPDSEKQGRPKNAQARCIYEEAAEVRKNAAGCSSDEEEPAYFNLLLLKNSLASQKLWTSRADPYMDRIKLEQNTKRLSGVKVLPSLPPKPFTSNLGSVSENRDSSAEELTRYQSLDEALSDDLIGLQSCNEAEMNKLRQWMVTNILKSEKSYCELLELLVSYMNSIKEYANSSHERISSKDIDTIFHGIQDLRNSHTEFVMKLQVTVDKWSKEQEIGTIIKEMIVQEYSIADRYLEKHQEAINAVQRCCSESVKFAELTRVMKCGQLEANLEELLRMPIERFQRNVLVLHDLKNCTPTGHPDFDRVQSSLRIAKNFFDMCCGNSRSMVEESRYLIRQGVVVEKPERIRKLRHIFLFNDILVCCKQKISPARQNRLTHRLMYEVKWFILICDLSLEDKFSAQEEKQATALHQQEISSLKTDLVRLQGELKAEIKKLKPNEGGQAAAGHRQNKTIENIRKKLAEQEAALLLASPHLQLKLSNRANKKTFVLLLASDYERTSWKSTISGLIGKGYQMPAKISLTDVISLINSQKVPKLLGSSFDNNDVSLDEEHLNGSLTVTIHKLNGLKEAADTFCSIEVDSYGHFFTTAKTNRAKGLEPTWNEDFDIDLEGAQSLHILCYRIGQHTDSLLGTCSLALHKEWINDDFQNKAISLMNELLLTVSLNYISPENLKRISMSSPKSAVFGARLERTVRKDNKQIPIIVTSCIEEIERRGLKDVGIYRVSGLSAEIQRLRKAFNKSSSQGASALANVDTNVLTGLLKLYFRELPEALFTDNGYPEFVRGIGLTDPDTKEKFMISQLSSLPPCNYATIIYLIGHLVRVSEHESTNKMSIQNLATVFGPTLLRPAEKDEKNSGVQALFCQGASEVALQSTILLFFLNLKAKNYTFPPPA